MLTARADAASELEALWWLTLLAAFDVVLLVVGTLVVLFLCETTLILSLFAWHYVHVVMIASTFFVCVARRLFVPGWLVAIAVVLFVIDAITLGRQLALVASLADACPVFLALAAIIFVVIDALYFAAIVVALKVYDLFGYAWLSDASQSPPKATRRYF